jgi:hypothetical protein
MVRRPWTRPDNWKDPGMRFTPRPAIVMLLWQLILFAAISMPCLLVFAWLHRAEFWEYLLIFAFLGGYGAALFKVSRLADEHGFRQEGTTSEEGEQGRLASLRLPEEFRGLAWWSWMAAILSGIVARPMPGEPGLFAPFALAASLYIVLCGWFWFRWSRGGLRIPLREPVPPPVEVTVGVSTDSTAPARSDEPLGAAWRFPEGSPLRQVVWEIIDTRCLPSIQGGSRTWTVAVDGRDVAIVTQTWNGPQWWPEPEWLIDPDTPLDGGRVEFQPGG